VVPGSDVISRGDGFVRSAFWKLWGGKAQSIQELILWVIWEAQRFIK